MSKVFTPSQTDKPIFFLFFELDFKVYFRAPIQRGFKNNYFWLRTRDLPRFVIVIKWIIIVFVYVILFDNRSSICIVSVNFKALRFALSFDLKNGWKIQPYSWDMQVVPILYKESGRKKGIHTSEQNGSNWTSCLIRGTVHSDSRSSILDLVLFMDNSFSHLFYFVVIFL